MPATRYYYSDNISKFLTRSAIEISGELAVSYTSDINKQTSNSWREEIETLQSALSPYKDRGTVYFEYNIPRMGRRADVVVLIDGVIFVLEYKTAESRFSREAEL